MRIRTTLAIALAVSAGTGGAGAAEKVGRPAVTLSALVSTLPAEQFALLREKGEVSLDAAALTAEQREALAACRPKPTGRRGATPISQTIESWTLRMGNSRQGVPQIELWSAGVALPALLNTQPLALRCDWK